MQFTLETLKDATAQQIFDQVATHLLKQNERSESGNGSCRYRIKSNGKPLMCAAGCLIADNEYHSDFENKSWTNLTNNGSVPLYHSDLIQDLQRVHDHGYPWVWALRLERLAFRSGLEFNLEKYKPL